jgi:hypothetical protein
MQYTLILSKSFPWGSYHFYHFFTIHTDQCEFFYEYGPCRDDNKSCGFLVFECIFFFIFSW